MKPPALPPALPPGFIAVTEANSYGRPQYVAINASLITVVRRIPTRTGADSGQARIFCSGGCEIDVKESLEGVMSAIEIAFCDKRLKDLFATNGGERIAQ